MSRIEEEVDGLERIRLSAFDLWIQALRTNNGGKLPELTEILDALIEDGRHLGYWDLTHGNALAANLTQPVPIYEYHGFRYDTRTLQLTTPVSPDTPIQLSAVKGEVFQLLITNAPETVTYGTLYRQIYPDDANSLCHEIRTYLLPFFSLLRKQIGDSRRDSTKLKSPFKWIKSVHPIGYAFNPDKPEQTPPVPYVPDYTPPQEPATSRKAVYA